MTNISHVLLHVGLHCSVRKWHHFLHYHCKTFHFLQVHRMFEINQLKVNCLYMYMYLFQWKIYTSLILVEFFFFQKCLSLHWQKHLIISSYIYHLIYYQWKWICLSQRLKFNICFCLTLTYSQMIIFFLFKWHFYHLAINNKRHM